MGVYIPNATLPSNCWNCRLESFADCDAHKCLSASDYKNRRYENCPLVDVSVPHGRLIDADALIADICNDLDAMTKVGIAVDGNWLWAKLHDALDNAQTVIEKEQ